MKKHRLTIRYTLHQIAYWGATAGIVSFAATFLLAKGFPASRVGALLACASLLSCVTQPILAQWADRAGKRALKPMIVALTGVSTLCFALVLADGLPAAVFGLLYLAGVWAFDAMMPLLNAVCVCYDEMGTPVNYGVGRGLGSLAYALAALGMGQVMERMGANWIRLIPVTAAIAAPNTCSIISSSPLQCNCLQTVHLRPGAKLLLTTPVFTPKKGTKACNLNFTKILRISPLIFLRKSCTLSRPQEKGGGYEDEL